MTELQQYLRSYTGVSDEDMANLVSYFHPMTLDKGDFFLKAGRVCDKLSFQRSGLLRVYANHEEKEVTQWISFKGTMITHLEGLICDGASPYNFQALTACEFYTVYKKDYHNISQTVPRWPSLEKMLITRCFSFMETRVFSLLSMSGDERYRYLQNTNPDLFDQVPLKYLASMMGMTPESLSRIRKKNTTKAGK